MEPSTWWTAHHAALPMSIASTAAAVDVWRDNVARPPLLIAVTILTSLDAKSLRGIGMSGSPAGRALALARLAKKSGMDGVVASVHEVRAIRRDCGPKFLIVTPGIRPAASSANDQSRVATPSAAIRAGADHLVVGRPITEAQNPRTAALAIANEMAPAQNR